MWAVGSPSVIMMICFVARLAGEKLAGSAVNPWCMLVPYTKSHAHLGELVRR